MKEYRPNKMQRCSTKGVNSPKKAIYRKQSR